MVGAGGRVVCQGEGVFVGRVAFQGEGDMPEGGGVCGGGWHARCCAIRDIARGRMRSPRVGQQISGAAKRVTAGVTEGTNEWGSKGGDCGGERTHNGVVHKGEGV